MLQFFCELHRNQLQIIRLYLFYDFKLISLISNPFLAEMKQKTRRMLILELKKQGNGVREIARTLKIAPSTVSDIIKRFEDSESVDDMPRSGRPRTSRTPKLIKVVRERIRRNPRRSMRKMARELQISEGSVRNIVKKDLRLRPYKLQKAHLLTKKNQQQRDQRCKALLKRLARGTHLKVVWSDEMPVSIEQEVNKQNDRILTPDISAANSSGRIVQKSAHPASLMVWGGINSDGKTPLVF